MPKYAIDLMVQRVTVRANVIEKDMCSAHLSSGHWSIFYGDSHKTIPYISAPSMVRTCEFFFVFCFFPCKQASMT